MGTLARPSVEENDWRSGALLVPHYKRTGKSAHPTSRLAHAVCHWQPTELAWMMRRLIRRQASAEVNCP